MLAKAHVKHPNTNEDSVLRFLTTWWCRLYNRPMKDPILNDYTLDELAYEYYTLSEREKLQQEQIEHEDDKIEQEKIDNALAWADEEEAKEKEALTQKQNKELNPAQNPENIEWMEEQMRIAKEKYGDSFGEDISENFDG